MPEECISVLPYEWRCAVLREACSERENPDLPMAFLRRLAQDMIARRGAQLAGPARYTPGSHGGLTLECLCSLALPGDESTAEAIARMLMRHAASFDADTYRADPSLLGVLRAAIDSVDWTNAPWWSHFWAAACREGQRALGMWAEFLPLAGQAWGADRSTPFVEASVEWFPEQQVHYILTAAEYLSKQLHEADFTRDRLISGTPRSRLLFLLAMPEAIGFPIREVPPLARTVAMDELLGRVNLVGGTSAEEEAWAANVMGSAWRLLGHTQAERLFRAQVQRAMAANRPVPAPLLLSALGIFDSLRRQGEKFRGASSAPLRDLGLRMLRDAESIQTLLEETLPELTDAQLGAFYQYVGTLTRDGVVDFEAALGTLGRIIGPEREARLRDSAQGDRR
jgi:hypothetical protein